jgi:peptidoglycan biosynthesis protein MviN/MurJ (putative lipid II flippase)
MSQIFTIKYPYVSSKPTMTKEINNTIKALISQNSQGYDEILTKILKISSSFISSQLNYVCNETVAKAISQTD